MVVHCGIIQCSVFVDYFLAVGIIWIEGYSTSADRPVNIRLSDESRCQSEVFVTDVESQRVSPFGILVS